MYKATSQDMKQLLSITARLSACLDSRSMRQAIADELLELLHGDMLASFTWNDQLQQFEDEAFVNMTVANLDKYQQHFQYCDPITLLLQQRRSATLVNEVMPQFELERTEFYQDFLRVDGLKWGINLYAYDGSLNIGDLRIWRGSSKQPFGDRELALLNMLKPHFTNSLINARSFSELRTKVSGWHDLWEHHPNACFVFDSSKRLSHQNEMARILFRGLSWQEGTSLLRHLQFYLNDASVDEVWGDYRLSFVKGGHAFASCFMVQLNPKSKLVIDRQWILSRFRLTAREADTCLWIMRGLSDQMIAEQACMSIWTVRTHIKSIFTKLEINGRSELTHLITSTIAEIHVAQTSSI